MTSFMEMENIMEVEPVKIKPEQVTRPSVIKKTSSKEEKVTPSLSEILTSCGIEYDMVESPVTMVESPVSSVSSPGSCHMDTEMENITEVEPVKIKPEQVTRPSVIKKTMTKEEKVTPSLSEILTSCGIEYDMVESPETMVESPVSS